MMQRFGKGRNNTRAVFQPIPRVTVEIYISACFTKDRRKVLWQFLETHLQLSKKVRQIFYTASSFDVSQLGVGNFSEIMYFLLKIHKRESRKAQ
jgi:hypothetical protein